MKKKTLALVVVCLVVGMCCSNVFALNLMGPPNAGLSKGQWEFGADYSMSEFALDFDFNSSNTITYPDKTRDKMKMDDISGRIGYGIKEWVDGFVRFGMADIKNSEDGEKYDGDGTSYGVGANFTIHEQEDLEWGVQAQVSWVDTDGEWSDAGAAWVGDADVKFMQIVVALGPNYQIKEGLSIYGGPFWYLLDGEKKYKETSPSAGDWEKYDLENKSDFGGFVGVQVDLHENVVLNIEYQLTSDDNIFAVGAVWRH